MVTLPAYSPDAPFQSGLDNFTVSKLLAANVPEFFAVPRDQNGLLAKYVTFGKPSAGDFYAQCYSPVEATDRVTNGTFADYVTNGAFASDTGWTKGTGWTIAGGVADIASTHLAISVLSQTSALPLVSAYSYTLTYTVALTSHVTNGTFASDTGWTKGAGWAIAAGVATATASSAALSQTCPQTLVAGRTYTVTYTVSSFAGGTVAVSLGGGTAGTAQAADGTFVEVITAGATQVTAFTGAGFTGSIDNVTITAVGTITASIGGTAGSARSTAATFIEAIVAGSTQIIAFTASANFVGTVDNVSVTGWVLGTGWTTDGTTAIATGAISTALSQTTNPAYPLIEGQAYLVTFTTTRDAGSVTLSLGGTAGTARSTAATFAEVLIAGSTQAISFGTSGFTGTIDNVTIIPSDSTPIDSTVGETGEQNPLGYFLNNNVASIAIVSAGTPIVTANFYR